MVFPNKMQTIEDFQAFHRWLDEKKGFNTDIPLNMMLLSGKVGEVAQVLKKVHFMCEPQRNERQSASSPRWEPPTIKHYIDEQDDKRDNT